MMMTNQLWCPRPMSVMMPTGAFVKTAIKKFCLIFCYRNVAVRIIATLSLSRTVLENTAYDETYRRARNADITAQHLQRCGAVKSYISSHGEMPGCQTCGIEGKALRDKRQLVYSYIYIFTPAARSFIQTVRKRCFVICAILVNRLNDHVQGLRWPLDKRIPYAARIQNEIGQMTARYKANHLYEQLLVKTPPVANRLKQNSGSALNWNDLEKAISVSDKRLPA